MGRLKKSTYSEKSIQKALTNTFLSPSTKKYELYNMFVYDWESDYLVITRSGYAYECEIKISRNDFFRDIKKQEKHLILEGKDEASKEPNYFYYVVPKDMISVDEVPEYAGLIYVVDDYFIQTVKIAPKLNDVKQDFISLNLIDKFYYRLKDREFQLEHNEVAELKKEINALRKQSVWYDNELSVCNCTIEDLKKEIEKYKNDTTK